LPKEKDVILLTKSEIRQVQTLGVYYLSKVDINLQKELPPIIIIINAIKTGVYSNR